MKKKYLSLALALVFCLTVASPLPFAAAGELAKPGAYTTVSAGLRHTAAIDQNGALWVWGEVGNSENQNTPVKIMDNVASVSCSGTNTAAIKTDGSLWMWGDNFHGQLGNGGGDIPKTPVKIMDDVAAVSCGSSTAAIKTDGSLWMWGDNSHGQLGNGGGGNAQGEFEMVYQTVPIKIMDNVAFVADGMDYTVAVKKDGSLWTCGLNNDSQLGNDGHWNRDGDHFRKGFYYQDFFGKVLDNVKLPKSGAAPVQIIDDIPKEIPKT